MNVQPSNQLPDNAILFMELPECTIHNFLNKNKEKRVEGRCQIYKINQAEETQTTPETIRTTYHLKINNIHAQTITNNFTFLRVSYPETTSYLFENSTGVISALSFNLNCPNLQKFETYFSEYAVILNYQSQNVQNSLKEKIIQACPDQIQLNDFTKDGKTYMKKIGKNIGMYVGQLSNWSKGPAQGAGKAFSERASRFTQSSIGDNTKTKWKTIVQKSSAINDFMTSLMRPLKNKCQNLTEKLGESFITSQNRIIINLRQYSYALRDSLNEGQKEALKIQKDKMMAEESLAQLK